MSAKIYCSTFAKYNNGSLKGEWIELEGHTKESFLFRCKEIHWDEPSPELMFQDFEGFPRELYSESFISKNLFEFLELSENEKEIVEAYLEATGYSGEHIEFENALEAFCGEYDSEEEFAEQTCEECEMIPAELPDWIKFCIDWKAVWESALRHDYFNSGKFFFRNN